MSIPSIPSKNYENYFSVNKKAKQMPADEISKSTGVETVSISNEARSKAGFGEQNADKVTGKEPDNRARILSIMMESIFMVI